MKRLRWLLLGLAVLLLGGGGVAAWAYVDRGYPFTIYYEHLIALPADFFDPPNTHSSLWDQATGWVHDHLGLGR